jgi:hypothetical protein
MEKRIKFFHFQSVIAVAKAIDPHLRTLATQKKKVAILKEEYDAKMAKLKAEFEAKAAKIKEEYDSSQSQIDSLETGILQNIGFHVTDLVKKVIEPTGKLDKAGKPIKETKYLPTDIVTYDKDTKEYVITIPDAEQPDHDMPAGTEECIVPPTTEDAAGSDYDKDAEKLEIHEEESEKEAAETEAENPAGQMPWD